MNFKSSLSTTTRLGTFVCLTMMLTACGNAQNFLDGIIEDKGYIPYNLPMASAGVGTIIKGSPSALNVVAHPQSCFPDKIGSQKTQLRWLSETDLPYINKKMEFGFNTDLSSLLMLGSPLINLNLGYEFAKKVELEFEGAAIEMLDQVRFFDHYSRMPDVCKLFVENYPIITQALRVNKMKFSFYNAQGVKIKLSPGMIGEIVNIGAGVNWSIENQYTLNINTPKYIGYQVSQMGKMDAQGAILRYHASELNRKNDFKWVQVHASSVKAMSTTQGWTHAEPLPQVPVGLNLLK